MSRPRVFDRFHRGRRRDGRDGARASGSPLVADLVRAHHGHIDWPAPRARAAPSPSRSRGPRRRRPRPASRARPAAASAGIDRRPRAAAGRGRHRPAGLPDPPADRRRLAVRRRRRTPRPRSTRSPIRRRPARPGLTDVMLPGRSGLHLVGELRAPPAHRRLPIIVLTARARRRRRRRGSRRRRRRLHHQTVLLPGTARPGPGQPRTAPAPGGRPSTQAETAPSQIRAGAGQQPDHRHRCRHPDGQLPAHRRPGVPTARRRQPTHQPQTPRHRRRRHHHRIPVLRPPSPTNAARVTNT